jgi:hypothetical protein
MSLMAIFSTESFKDMGVLNQNHTNMKDNSEMASIMVKESTLGALAMSTKEPIKTARNTDMESTRPSMDLSTKAIGRMAKETAKALRYRLMESLKMSHLTWGSRSLACNDISQKNLSP